MRSGLLRFMPCSARICLASWASVGLLALACEPDWSELTSERGAAGRGGASGSSGTAAEAGSGIADGGVPSNGGSSAEGGVPTESGGEPAAAGAGEGGTPTDDGAVDLPGTATADSEETVKGNLAPNGHDGDTTTKWVANDGELGHYWTLDLQSVHTLARVKIMWEYPQGPQSNVYYLYTVSVSDDGVVYQIAIDKQDNQEATSEQVAEMPAGTTGRYVRITVTGLAPAYWASFYEARVFGFPQVP
jgi:hypothetical protein